MEVDHTDGEYTVIHLYEVATGHTATWGWYYIDRSTGKGYDFLTNDSIDLTPYAPTGVQDGKAALDAYRDFVLNGTYLAMDYSGINRAPDINGGWGVEAEKAFALHDMDKDSIPELFIYNGDMSQICAIDYIYTYADGKVQLLGSCGSYPRYFPGTEYPGIFSTFQSSGEGSGSYVTKQGSLLNSEIVYSYNNHDGTGGQLKQRTNDYRLYRLFVADDGTPSGGELLYHAKLSELNSMGWDKFVTKALPEFAGGESSNLRTVNLPFYSGLGNKTNHISVDWGWSLFDGPALTSKEYETYDNRLAITGLALSAASEQSQSRAEELLDQLGFDDIISYNYGQPPYIIAQPGVTFGHKRMNTSEQEQHLFAVVVRGTTNMADVMTDIFSLAGAFQMSGQNIYDLVIAYIRDTCHLNSADLQGNARFFVTGHSLGGAACNVLAKKLNESYGSKNVFAYTFASPTTAFSDSDIGESGNIYNVLNSEDVVPLVPPTLQTRYGSPSLITLTAKTFLLCLSLSWTIWTS